MRNKQIKISNKILDELDLNYHLGFNMSIGNKYFPMLSGKEHYRLLHYIVSLYNNVTILDIGTSYGASALALSSNPKNKVISFDIKDFKRDNFISRKNIEFVLNCDLESYKTYSPKIVFLDASKDSSFESDLISALEPILVANKSILIIDDYYEYPIVQSLVGKLSEKYKVHNLTGFGHYSGTHLIDFSNKLDII